MENITFGAALGATAALGLAAGLYWYIWARLVRDVGWPAKIRRWATPGYFLLGAGLPTAAVIRHVGQTGSPWFALFLCWGGFLFMTLSWLLIGEAALAVLAGGRRLTGGKPHDADRRVALRRLVGGAATTLGLGSSGVAVTEALAGPEVTRVTVPLARLPNELSGLTIAQISDLHISPLIDRAYVERVVALTNALKPHVIVLTGDLVDGPLQLLRSSAAPLAQLKAPYGVYFVTGNHEYYAGVTEWLAALQELGIRPLRNERVSIGTPTASFDLAGVDDLTGNRYDNGHGANLPAALAGRDPARELILLAHQPKFIHEAAAQGVGLMLSGHTHGGQIWPMGWLVRLVQPYVQGLALHGSTYIYVNRGTGYVGPPMRLGARAEITRVELTTLRNPTTGA